jgi:uncharacterized protein (DUF58 family)
VIKITKAGYFYISLTIILGFSAVNTANNLVYIIAAAMLSFMAVSGFFGRGNLRGISIVIDVPEEIYARRPVPIRVTLINSRRFLPAFLIRISLGETTILFPFVDSQQRASRFVQWVFPKRGTNHFDRVYFSSVFPFNFFIRSKDVTGDYSYLVFPEPQRCTLLEQSQDQPQQLGKLNSPRSGYEDDLIAVRNYVDGDPLKHINWKATARTDQLKTKQFAAPLAQPVILDLANLPPGDLDTKLSWIAYTINRCMKHNTPIGLKLDEQFFPPGMHRSHRLRMLKELAIYGSD